MGWSKCKVQRNQHSYVVRLIYVLYHTITILRYVLRRSGVKSCASRHGVAAWLKSNQRARAAAAVGCVQLKKYHEMNDVDF